MASLKKRSICVTSDDDLSENLLVLCNQEEIYKVSCYLDFINENLLENGEKAIDEECRMVMGNWCCKIVDHYKFNADTAFIAMSHVDRFLSTTDGNFALYDRQWFQLVVLTCLQLAIKTNESFPLHIDNLIALGRTFSKEDISSMEKEILSALAWRLTPPIPSTFLHLMLYLFPPSVPNSMRMILWKDAKKYLQLCTLHYSLSIVKPSLLTITLLFIEMGKEHSQDVIDEFVSNVNIVTDFNYSINDILPLKEKIVQLSIGNATSCKEIHHNTAQNDIEKEATTNGEKKSQREIINNCMVPMKPKVEQKKVLNYVISNIILI